jgi:hypothetical protein
MALDFYRDGIEEATMRTYLTLSYIVLIALCGCSRERPSRIVKTAEDAGAGKLSDVSTVDMRMWLNAHPEIAIRVDALCAPVRRNATAAWPKITEGRLCAAARASVVEIDSKRHPRRDPDSTGFLPGWK